MTKQEFDDMYARDSIAINCRTEESAENFLALAHSFGYKWYSGKSLINCTYYHNHRQETCYRFRTESFVSYECCQTYKEIYSCQIIEYNIEIDKDKLYYI